MSDGVAHLFSLLLHYSDCDGYDVRETLSIIIALSESCLPCSVFQSYSFGISA